jgi:hypothetical protein
VWLCEYPNHFLKGCDLVLIGSRDGYSGLMDVERTGSLPHPKCSPYASGRLHSESARAATGSTVWLGVSNFRTLFSARFIQTRRLKRREFLCEDNDRAPEHRLEPGDQGMVLHKMRSDFRSCQRKRCARGIRPTRVPSSFGRKNYNGSRNQNHASLEKEL